MLLMNRQKVFLIVIIFLQKIRNRLLVEIIVIIIFKNEGFIKLIRPTTTNALTHSTSWAGPIG